MQVVEYVASSTRCFLVDLSYLGPRLVLPLLGRTRDPPLFFSSKKRHLQELWLTSRSALDYQRFRLRLPHSRRICSTRSRTCNRCFGLESRFSRQKPESSRSTHL